MSITSDNKVNQSDSFRYRNRLRSAEAEVVRREEEDMADKDTLIHLVAGG